MRLQGKVAIVTGAGQVIGLAYAKRFLREGASVVIAEQDEKRGAAGLEALVDLGPAMLVHTDVADPDSVVAQQEFFGPVQCLIAYEDEKDAIRIANNSSYGLSGGILGADIERAKRVARRLRTGSLMINGGMWYGPDVPFGGYKHSGLGRENGVLGFEEFLEVKALAEPAS